MSYQEVFHSFLSDNRKQYSATTAAHIKTIMGLLQNIKVSLTKNNTIWDNTDGCAEKYICATEIYLLSMLSHAYTIVIDSVIVAPGHGEYFVDFLNATYKRFVTMFMKTVQLPGESTNDSQIVIHTSMSNTDISLAT